MEMRGNVMGRVHPDGGKPVDRTDDQVLAERFARNFERMARDRGEFPTSALARCGIDRIRFDAMRRGDIGRPVTFGDLLAVTKHFNVQIGELAL